MQIEEKEFKKFLTITKGLSKNSIRTYTNRFLVIKRWLHDNELKLTADTAVDFLFEKKDEQELSNAAVNTYRQALIHIDAYCKSHSLSHGFTEGLKNLPK